MEGQRDICKRRKGREEGREAKKNPKSQEHPASRPGSPSSLQEAR